MLTLPDLTGLAPVDVSRLSEPELVAHSRRIAAVQRWADAAQAEVAAELNSRSRREDGSEGMAQRLGQRTPERLLQTLTGVTAREARRLVAVGELMTANAPGWLGEVGKAVESGAVSVDAAEAITTGLGDPTGSVDAGTLAHAAEQLLAEAATSTVEELAKTARFMRDELDAEGVADRERALHDSRAWRITENRDGSGSVHARFDPESFAVVKTVFDGITAPRRGGPRFVDSTLRLQAKAVTDDSRTTEQLALDAMVEIIRLGAAADPNAIVGPVRSVNILTTAADLQAHGMGFIEGSQASVSTGTVERAICDGGVRQIVLTSDGEVLDLGREQRRYTSTQRIALAARDGGCRFPGCDRPPSWTEAHHTIPWSRNGRTDLADGILLCRHHHLLIHNNGWKITRHQDGRFTLIPPRTIDPMQTPIAMPTRSKAVQRLQHTA